MSVSLNNAAVIAALIALVGVFITQIVSIALDERRTRLTRKLDDLRARETRDLEVQRAHEAALQKYLEQVGKLLTQGPEPPNFGTVARAQTLALLKGLRGDRDRKRVVMLFLSESNLLEKHRTDFNLRLADLSDADLGGLGDGILCCKNLSETHLERANLSETDVRNTDLTRAYLMEANLQDANFEGASLEGADLQAAKELTQDQIEWTVGSNETKLPEGRARPELWRKSFEEQVKILQERPEVRGLAQGQRGPGKDVENE
jgi:hypothetical protein